MCEIAIRGNVFPRFVIEYRAFGCPGEESRLHRDDVAISMVSYGSEIAMPSARNDSLKEVINGR
jgi:hypothetical protein